MNTENKLRQLARSKLTVRITRKRRGPYILVRPDGKTTEHPTRKEALNRLLVEMRCTNKLTWTITSIK